MNRQATTLTTLVILALTLGGCASLGGKPTGDQPSASLSAADVQALVKEALADDAAAKKAETSMGDTGVDEIVESLKAANFNHPGMAVKREIRGCTLQMVLYADADIKTATNACIRIYSRRHSRAVNGTPVLMETQ